MHRWELEAKALVKSMQFKDMTEREIQLWDHLRMCLDDLERYRQEEEQRIYNVNNENPHSGKALYGDGY